jgi:uncharacterized protein (TIGR03437 family)
MPTLLDGTSVRINGRAAAIYYISPTQLNVLGPSDQTEGDVTVEVTTQLGVGSRTARLQRFAPGLFLLDPENRKYVAAVHAAGGLVGKAGLYPNAPNLTLPLAAGGRALLFGSGWGPTDPPQPDGEVFTSARRMINSEQLRVTIGGWPAQVEFAGAVGAGLYQFNIVAPANLTTGDHSLVVEMGSFRSQPNVFISIVGSGGGGGGSGGGTGTSTVVLQLDDGSFETAIGAAGGNVTAYFLNRLTPPDYPATLRSVSIFFGTESDKLPAGHVIQVRSGANPGGSPEIGGVQLRDTQAAVSRTGQFETFAVPPITIASGDFVVGFAAFNPPDIFPIPHDTTPLSRERSYYGAQGSAPALIESYPGLGGNFAIRAHVDVPGTAPVAAPIIRSLSVTEAAQGQTITSLTITGERLAGALQVRANPATGMTFSNLRSNQGSVTVDLKVAADAPVGARQISVVTPGGESNTLALAVRLTCTYGLSSSSISVDAAGGERTVNIQSPTGCNWQVSGAPSWITVRSGASGSGNGSVRLAVAANSSSSSRTGLLKIATETLSVTQSGAALSPISKTIPLDLPPVAQTTLIWDDSWFFVVPQGATKLTVRLVTATAGVDLDLFVRFGTKPTLSNGQIVADFRAQSYSGSETITVSQSALRPGRYYFAVGQFTLDQATSASVTGTVEF